jgi:hypothetical protein
VQAGHVHHHQTPETTTHTNTCCSTRARSTTPLLHKRCRRRLRPATPPHAIEHTITPPHQTPTYILSLAPVALHTSQTLHSQTSPSTHNKHTATLRSRHKRASTRTPGRLLNHDEMHTHNASLPTHAHTQTNTPLAQRHSAATCANGRAGGGKCSNALSTTCTSTTSAHDTKPRPGALPA